MKRIQKEMTMTTQPKKTVATAARAMLLALGVLIVLGAPTAQAATRYWAGDDTTAGGDGSWNFTDTAWRTHPTAIGAQYMTNWVAGDMPQFQGGPGTVTLETNILISVGMKVYENMTFDGPFSLQLSGGALTGLSSTTATVDCAVMLLVGADIRNNYVINGNISDDGGAYRSIEHSYDALTLNGSNSFGGGVVLNNGTLVIGNDHALGTGILDLDQSEAVLEAGGGARSVTNVLTMNWDSPFNVAGTNDLTFTSTQTLKGGQAPPDGPRYNVMETNTVLTFGGLVRDSRYNSGMTKEGPGTMVVEGAYDATYGTVVTGGTFLVNGTTTAVINDYGYTVFEGAALGGTGVVNLAASGSTCTVYQAGALAPGASVGGSVGTLTINGPVSMAENSIYKWEYQDSAGDLVDINGTLTLPAVATVMVSQVSGDMPEIPTLFTADTLAGAGAADVSGWVIEGAQGYIAQIEGTAVTLYQPPPVGTTISIR